MQLAANGINCANFKLSSPGTRDEAEVASMLKVELSRVDRQAFPPLSFSDRKIQTGNAGIATVRLDVDSSTSGLTPKKDARRNKREQGKK